MAFALSIKPSVAVALQSSPSNERAFPNHSRFSNFFLPHRVVHRSPLCMARRRRIETSKKKTKEKEIVGNGGMKEDFGEDDPLEALFKQLEEDLAKEGSTTDADDDSDITEEDIDRLASELETVLGDFDLGALGLNTAGEVPNDNGFDDGDDDDEEDEEPVELKNWQLRRLASALRVGRRKTNIKALAAELCLDRSVVLEHLRDPPANLVLMSAALPDEPTPTLSTSETKHVESEKIVEEVVDVEKPQKYKKEPIHVMQHRWSTQKRLKKVHLRTLECVYKKSKRPTDAMISSIIHVTNLPRKKILKWFDDKRNEEGIPEIRHPYPQPTPESTLSQ